MDVASRTIEDHRLSLFLRELSKMLRPPGIFGTGQYMSDDDEIEEDEDATLDEGPNLGASNEAGGITDEVKDDGSSGIDGPNGG
jgi:hypothetical protein